MIIQDLVGTYNIRGKNQEDTELNYTSTLTLILDIKNRIEANWIINHEQEQTGTGFFKDNIRVSLVNPSEVTTAFTEMTRAEREEQINKLGSNDIAQTIISVVEMRDKGFVPEVTVWATNPF